MSWGKRCKQLLTPGGSKLIEAFEVGDAILTRTEFDAEAACEVKTVGAVFTRVSPVIGVSVCGLTIETTKEHPFYVRGRGWLPAGELRTGDELHSHDGQWYRVDAIADLGRVETVYNLMVEDHHTYFVGGDEWGFSVWAHNAACGEGVRLALEAEGISIPVGDPRLDVIAKHINDGNLGAARNAIKDLPGSGKLSGKKVTGILDAAENPPVSGSTAPAQPTQSGQAGRAATAQQGHTLRLRVDEILEELRPGDYARHGDPSNWTYQRTVVEDITGPGRPKGAKKVYEIYTDVEGRQVGMHYEFYPDGSVHEVKFKYPETTGDPLFEGR